MKKIVLIGLVILILCVVSVSYADTSNIPVKPDNIAIFQGVSSYAYFSSDKKIIEELYKYITSLDYEKISKEKAEKERDFLTQFMIHFVCGKKDVLRFHIDKNGIMWFQTYKNGILLPSENKPDIQYYKVTGDYDYEYINRIYQPWQGTADF